MKPWSNAVNLPLTCKISLSVRFGNLYSKRISSSTYRIWREEDWVQSCDDVWKSRHCCWLCFVLSSTKYRQSVLHIWTLAWYFKSDVFIEFKFEMYLNLDLRHLPKDNVSASKFHWLFLQKYRFRHIGIHYNYYEVLVLFSSALLTQYTSWLTCMKHRHYK